MASHLAHQEPSPPPWHLQAFLQHWHTSSPQQSSDFKSHLCARKHLLCSSSFIFPFLNNLFNQSNYNWIIYWGSYLTKSIFTHNSSRSTSPNSYCMSVFMSFQSTRVGWSFLNQSLALPCKLSFAILKSFILS